MRRRRGRHQQLPADRANGPDRPNDRIVRNGENKLFLFLLFSRRVFSFFFARFGARLPFLSPVASRHSGCRRRRPDRVRLFACPAFEQGNPTELGGVVQIGRPFGLLSVGFFSGGSGALKIKSDSCLSPVRPSNLSTTRILRLAGLGPSVNGECRKQKG